jgi:hypothetical protein
MLGILLGLIVAGDEANHEEGEDGCFHEAGNAD